MAVVTKFLTNSNGKMLVDSTTGKPLSVTIDVVHGLSIRLAERVAVSTTYSTFASYSTTSQTYSNITNASEFAVGDVAILQWTITDRDNTAGIIFAEVSAVSSNSITAKGLGMSVKGDNGDDGTTFTPSVDANGNLSWTNDGSLENPETVNIKGAQGESATVQVGTVTTGAAGTNASVTNSGTENAAVFDFIIPKGEDGVDGTTPNIGANGNWFIGDEDTNVKAAGTDGTDGITPHIGSDGYWYVGDTNTNIKAEGTDGTDGTNGVTPHIGENGNWFIGEADTGKPSQGISGVTGEGVYGFNVEDGNLMLVLQDEAAPPVTYEIEENGDLCITIQ